MFLIDANGGVIKSFEFAAEIFKKIKLRSKEDIEKWYLLFKKGIWTE